VEDIYPSHEHHVFTTNYDSIIERFCVETGTNFSCGFRTDSKSERRFWHPDELKNWKVKHQHGISIYKLHGSLDWRETADGRFERMQTEERVSKTTRRFRRNILIYPAQKDYTLREPFRRLMRHFEEALSQHHMCLVIGFSFRDPFINNTFLEFLRSNRKRRMIAVSPNATEHVEKNLISEEKRLKKQITCLDKLFGEDETFQVIRDALSLKPKRTEEEEDS
jgi:hypothetical protein